MQGRVLSFSSSLFNILLLQTHNSETKSLIYQIFIKESISLTREIQIFQLFNF